MGAHWTADGIPGLSHHLRDSLWALVSLAPREIYNPTPWCWARQVFNQTLWNDGEYHCVRCADDACIARWSAQRWVAKVNWQICEYQRGWN
mmetsp:Transcript_6265/g.14200  ORF Transcript_6265/g.14200 Transcript_6265/m.14200 type:complete len:91 (-) Transcript_6265:7-279(-)